MARDKLRPLKDKLEKAIMKGKLPDAIKLLTELEAKDPKGSRWPHKLGDLQRREGNLEAAVAAYERAVERYAAAGFIARSVAMAKTIQAIDGSRNVMQKVEQESAQSMQRRSMHVPEGAPAPAPVDLGVVAQPLAPATDAGDDEVRFDDTELPVDFGLAAALPEEEIDFFDLDDLSSDDEVEEMGAEQMAVLPSFQLFAELPREAMLVLAERSKLVELDPGQSVLRKGDPADSLYAIVSGSVEVHITGKGGAEHRISLTEGEVFGEACLLSDEPRHADVSVLKRLTALHIGKDVLDELVEAYPEVGGLLLSMLTRRLIVNVVRTSPMFEELDFSVRREIAAMFEIRKAAAGASLIEAGKRVDALYIPLTGKLELSAGSDTRMVQAGSIVGQASVLSQQPSGHSVRTVGETVTLRLPASRLMDVMTRYPAVLQRLARASVIPSSE